MVKVTFSVSGADIVANKLRTMADLEKVHSAVKESSAELEKIMTKNAVFVKGYSTGATRRSIHGNVNGLSATVGATMKYDPYVEYGTRKMEAQPFAKPSKHEITPIFIDKLKGAFDD